MSCDNERVLTSEDDVYTTQSGNATTQLPKPLAIDDDDNTTQSKPLSIDDDDNTTQSGNATT